VWGISLLLALGTWLVFSPVWRFEFFRFDDPQYILDNPAVKAGLTGPGLAWALRATQAGNWHPLTWVSHMLDCQLFGIHAGWFHLVNATFHALNAALLPGVTEEAFYHNWQQVHSVQSFALHPLRVSYVRNAVARVLTPGARDYRIIVLEHWQELRDFTEDARYFGSPEAVAEMYRDLPGFADSSSTTTGPASEYAFD